MESFAIGLRFPHYYYYPLLVVIEHVLIIAESVVHQRMKSKDPERYHGQVSAHTRQTTTLTQPRLYWTCYLVFVILIALTEVIIPLLCLKITSGIECVSAEKNAHCRLLNAPYSLYCLLGPRMCRLC